MQQGAFVGRSVELEALAGVVRGAARGTGSVALIGGETGIGKTRLLRELSDRHGGGRATVVIAACSPADRGSEPLASLCKRLNIRAGGPIEDALLDISVGRTLVLMFDDAQWASEETLAFVASFARALVNHRILLVVAYRSDEMSPDHPALRYLGRIGREPGTLHIELAPLTVAETRRLVLAAAPSASRDNVARMSERSQGNPRDALALAEASRDPRGGAGLEMTLRAAAAERLAAFSDGQRRVLEAAAVFGVRFDSALLAHVAQAPVDEVLAAMRKARDQKILEELEGDPPAYGYRRTLLREGVAAGMLTEELTRLRGRASEALAATGFGERAVLDAQRSGRYAEAAALHEYLLAAETGAAARASRLAQLAEALARAGDLRRSSHEYRRSVEAFVNAGLPGEAAATFALWGVVAIRAGDARRALAAGSRLPSTTVLRQVLASLRAHLGFAPEGSDERSALDYAFAGDRLAWRTAPRETDLGALDAAAAAYVLGVASDVEDSPGNGYERALSFLQSIRRGELQVVRAAIGGPTDAGAAGEASGALLAAAALWIEHHCGDDAAIVDLDLGQRWDDALASGDLVVIGAVAAPYARHLLALKKSGRANAVLAAAFDALGDRGAFAIEALLAAAEWGDAPVAKRAAGILAGAGELAASHLPIVAARAHVAALDAARAGDGASAAREALAARAAYRSLGWRLHEAAADRLAGDLGAAIALFRDCGANHDVRRAERALQSRGAVAVRGGGGLTSREREIAELIAAGISNRQIAQRISIAPKSVEKHVSSIYKKLGLTSRTQLATFMSHGNAKPAARGWLPSPFTPFVGRTLELQELDRRLPRARLVVLTGTGGCGKTRLAIEAARRCAREFDGGAWFVDVAPMSSSATLLPAIASALGVAIERGAEVRVAIGARLQNQRTLIVLDNCEHILEGLAPVLRGLLQAASGLHLLLTSRERVGMLDETVVRIEPMTLADASELFIERLESRRSQVHSAAVIERLCERLDCLPLALELGAAQLSGMTLDELFRQLDARVPLLGTSEEGQTSRHRAIEAVVDQSYASLREDERHLFRQLAVCRGPITTVSVDAMLGAGAHEGLSLLHRKSLLELSDGEGRYRMLAVIRDVAEALLREAGEEEAAHAALTRYCRAMLDDVDERWATRPVSEWLEPILPEEANILAALDWALVGGNAVEHGIALVAGAARVWGEQSREPEMEPYIARALELQSQASPESRGWLFLAHSRYCEMRGAAMDALEVAQSAHALFWTPEIHSGRPSPASRSRPRCRR